MKKITHPEHDELAEELSGQFEGDIVISQAQMDELEEMRRIGHRDTKYRWKDNTVPFKIDSTFFCEYFQVNLILLKEFWSTFLETQNLHRKMKFRDREFHDHKVLPFFSQRTEKFHPSSDG